MINFEPLFDFTLNESSILIHQSKAEVCIDKSVYSGEGEARLELLPKANIYLYGYFRGVPVKDAIGAHLGQNNVSSFSINGHQVKGFKLSSGGDARLLEYNIKWCPNSQPINVIGCESTQMDFLIFHLFNFLNFRGGRRSVKPIGSALHAFEHLDLLCDEWKIEIKSLSSTNDQIKKLKEEGGYRLTHIGVVKKADNTQFTGEEATKCLNALEFFLSFAKGGWCEPICSVGFDSPNSRIWESWSSPRETWHEPLTWFDAHNAIQMVELFPGFMNKWRDADWREAFNEVIYWYLNANFPSRGIDAGIILTQAAIERLSYEYSVRYKKLVTAKGFKDLWASDKFRLLFSSLNIPIEITGDTPKIETLSKSLNWLDAPHALTEIRNSLVHPENKKRGKLDDAYYEAWNLGLWFLEMGILAICGYLGNCGNRLKQKWRGQVEKVPWSKI